MNRPPKRALHTLACLAAGLIAATTAQASALKWDKTEQIVDTEFGQEEVKAVYSFVNESEQTVKVTDIRPSCSCTVPSLEKTEYAAGESGELTVIFTVGVKQGLQHKTVALKTDVDGTEEDYQLVLQVNIPVPITLKPRVRFWNIGDTVSTQDVAVTLHEKLPMNITGLVRKDTNQPVAFDYTIETLEEGHEYSIKLTPKSMDTKARDVFYLESPDDTKDLLRNFPIYLYVR